MEDDQRILLALGRLEGKVDSLISRDLMVQADMEKLGDRMRTLEASRATMLGACAVITALISFTITYITSQLR